MIQINYRSEMAMRYSVISDNFIIANRRIISDDRTLISYIGCFL